MATLLQFILLMSALALFPQFGYAKGEKKAQSILITYFSPFRGKLYNQSSHFAEVLEKELKELSYSVEKCELPVKWKKSIKAFKKCFKKKRKFDLVIGLGEHSGPATLSLGAQKKVSGSSDEEKKVMTKKQGFKKDDPESLFFRFDWKKAYCKTPELKSIVEDSVRSPGTIYIDKFGGSFICNYFSYKAEQFLMRKKTPFVFLHVASLEHYKMLFDLVNTRALFAERSAAAKNMAALAQNIIKYQKKKALVFDQDDLDHQENKLPYRCE